ncbi:MAG: HAD-IIA family hydrolase [bacterium]
MIIDNYDSFIFDLDGTIYLSDRLIKGAKEVINYINSVKKDYVFLTNKPLATKKEYSSKLTQMGIKTTEENIITSSYVTAQYLKEKSPGAKCYIIGEEALKYELIEAGLIVTNNLKEVDYLIASFDRRFNYNKLNNALQLIKKGVKFVATNPDKTCPVEGGEIPDTAGMIGAIEGTSGKKVEKIFGKPSKEIITIAINKMNVKDLKKCLMIGDRIETDIIMGIENGLSTALVLSGVSNKCDYINSNLEPDHILKSVYDLLK